VKRDMDLARRILFDVENCEDADGTSGWLVVQYDEHPPKEVMYHIILLAEAGLIETHDVSDLGGSKCWPKRLTWLGHEFLDAARDDTRWKKAKRLVIEKAGSLSFELLKQALVKLATESVGQVHPFA
jgi:Hypothetical protein (DUF2513)